MTPEDIQTVYYESMSKRPRDGVVVQQELQLAAWADVAAYVRKHYEDENERLRQRVRDLEAIVAKCMEDAAQ